MSSRKTGPIDVITEVVNPLADALSVLVLDCVSGQVTPAELDTHTEQLNVYLQVHRFFTLFNPLALGPGGEDNSKTVWS
jgi:hypothetical protein